MHRPIAALAAALVALSAAPRLHAQASPTIAASGGTLEIQSNGAGAYASTTMPLHLSGGHAARAAGEVALWETSDPSIAWVATNGSVVFLRDGRVMITARRGSDSASRVFDVRANPAARVALSAPARARVGQLVRIDAMALDADGRAVADEPVNLAASSGASVRAQRFVAEAPGAYSVTAQAGAVAATRTIVVDGPSAEQQGESAATRVELPAPPFVAYAGTTVPLSADVWRAGSREAARTTNVQWTSADTGVATISPNGVLTAVHPGRATITARAGSALARRDVTVYPNPAARVTLSTDIRDVFVGDSLRLHVDALAPGARQVEGAHIVYGVTEPGSPDGAHATVTPDGQFVASRAGVYTIFAAIGDRADQQTILVQQRPAR